MVKGQCNERQQGGSEGVRKDVPVTSRSRRRHGSMPPRFGYRHIAISLNPATIWQPTLRKIMPASMQPSDHMSRL